MSWRFAIGKQLQSVKILAEPTAASSNAARKYWEKNAPLIKHLNPNFLFMLRPAPDLEPYMIVQYDFNYRVKINLAGLDEAAIEEKLNKCVEVGKEMPKAPEQSGPRFQPSVIE